MSARIPRKKPQAKKRALLKFGHPPGAVASSEATQAGQSGELGLSPWPSLGVIPLDHSVAARWPDDSDAHVRDRPVLRPGRGPEPHGPGQGREFGRPQAWMHIELARSATGARAGIMTRPRTTPNIRVSPSQDVGVRRFAIDRPRTSAQAESLSHCICADIPDTRECASAAPRGRPGGLCWGCDLR